MKIRGWMKNLEIAIRFLGQILGLDQGSIVLNNGDHVVFIPTDVRPTRVHLSFTNHNVNDGTQVCQGDLNFFSVTLANRGFNLFAKVRSDATTLVWVAIHDRTGDDDDD